LVRKDGLDHMRKTLPIIILGLVGVLVQIFTEFAGAQPPSFLREYLWLAWPTLIALAVVYICISFLIEIRRHRRRIKAPFLVPDKQYRDKLVGRDELFSKLKQLLLARGDPPRIVLQLLPGVGKSELAIHLARDRTVREHFSGGVLWANLGSKPDIRMGYCDWSTKLGIFSEEMGEHPKIQEWKAAIEEAMVENRKRLKLLLLDDVWDPEVVIEPFLFSDEANCAYLVTTRLPKVANHLVVEAGFTIEVVQELDESESLELLGKMAPEAVKADRQTMKDLVEAAGRLPLALTLMGNELQKRARNKGSRALHEAVNDLREVKKRLNLELTDDQKKRFQGLSENKNVSSLVAVIDLSYEALDDEKSRRALRRLSIFRPKPYTFAEAAALKVTGASTKTLDTLVDRGLLESSSTERESGGQDRYALQRTIADYARLKLSDKIAEELHRKAADYYADQLNKY